ncbi:hypothetical protein NG726_41410, partial [Pseudomonas sp. MOB-449]|nr:hypothetical protein [Pseudomonas sp. MOB-449]
SALNTNELAVKMRMLRKNLHDAIDIFFIVYQDWFTLIDDLTISPKPPSSKMVTNFQKLDHILTSLQENDRQHAVSLK